MDWLTISAMVVCSLLLIATMAYLRYALAMNERTTARLRAESKRFEAEWQKFLNEVEAAVTNK